MGVLILVGVGAVCLGVLILAVGVAMVGREARGRRTE